MALMKLTPFSGALFSVSLEEKSLVAEHSDLGCYPGIQQRIYDDACDVGFAILGRVGVTTWCLAKEERDGEGDLQVTIFEPTPETLRKYPHLAGWTVHVLND